MGTTLGLLLPVIQVIIHFLDLDRLPCLYGCVCMHFYVYSVLDCGGNLSSSIYCALVSMFGYYVSFLNV